MGISDLLGDFGAAGSPRSKLEKRKKKAWKPPPSTERWSDLYSTCSTGVMTTLETARAAIGTIEAGETLHVISHGQWAMEHPICVIGEQLGPVDLWLATWAINDDAVLRLAEAMRRGFIRECRAIVDERMKVVRPAAMDILQTALGQGRLGTMACHAKFYALRQVDGERGVSITSSANLTANPRPEAMVFCANMRAVDFYAGWVEHQLASGAARAYQHTGKLKAELVSTKSSSHGQD